MKLSRQESVPTVRASKKEWYLINTQATLPISDNYLYELCTGLGIAGIASLVTIRSPGLLP